MHLENQIVAKGSMEDYGQKNQESPDCFRHHIRMYCRFLLHTIRQRNAERRCHNYCSRHFSYIDDSGNHWRLNCQLLVMAQVRRMARQNIQLISQDIKSAIFSIPRIADKNTINEVLRNNSITFQDSITEAENKLEKTLKIIEKSLHL